MINPDPQTAADDATRLSRMFLASLREGRMSDARIQLAALNDVMPADPPPLDLSELHAGHEPEAEAADEPVPYALTAKAEALLEAEADTAAGPEAETGS
jgi:hypothetical protein